ncbi:MAG: hypothetical protein KC543_03720 [Myxococcales bacterium]|nr:hypothetical protein [Myxococcales bacterium]
MTAPLLHPPPAPVAVDAVLDAPEDVYALARRGAPYGTVQRYVASATEMSALSDAGRRARKDRPVFVAPWFRGDWAYDTPLLDGAETFLHNARLFDAARALFDGHVVVPQIVYINLNAPMPAVDPGHTDVPAFRGVDRTRYPVWLLVTMLRSGLFEPWRVSMATAVAWYYRGPGGGFKYWPDGPAAAPVHRPCQSNTALVGDNDRMFHCVEAVGEPLYDMPMDLSLDAELHSAGGGWEIRDRGTTRARYGEDEVRISVSWKAQVFPDEAARRVYAEHRDDLTLPAVRDALVGDLRERGATLADAVWSRVEGDDGVAMLSEEPFIAALNDAYRVTLNRG